MPTTFDRLAQLAGSTLRRNESCRRAICRRYRNCIPPRDAEHPFFFRCPFDAEESWIRRAEAVGKVAERLMKVAETSRAARGLPSPFAAKPVADHLDLTKPLDFAALLATPPEKEP